MKRFLKKKEEQSVPTDSNSNNTTVVTETSKRMATEIAEELVRDNAEAGVPAIEPVEEDRRDARQRDTVTNKIAQLTHRQLYAYLADRLSENMLREATIKRRQILEELRTASRAELLDIIDNLLVVIETLLRIIELSLTGLIGKREESIIRSIKESLGRSGGTSATNEVALDGGYLDL